MQIRTEVKNNLTYVYIDGIINSTNANEFSDKIKDEPKGTDGLVLDCEKLEYISSAGLRVILSAKKRCGDKTFKVINVNSEVMEVFKVTGFDEIMDITQTNKKISVEDCDIIGRGSCGECYRIDDETIIKLYYGNTDISVIEHEKALSKKAFVMGIPTAISYDIVEADGRIGVVYELIKSKTLAELMRTDPDNLDKYIKMYADICKSIHAIHTDDPDIPSFKDLNKEGIKLVTGITDEERDLLNKFVDMIPDGNSCIHGDLNVNNIMVQDGECCLIDMGEFGKGIPMFDISRIVFSMECLNTKPNEFNAFYKMSSEMVTYIFKGFLKEYYGTSDINEILKIDGDAKWMYPLAWLRCVTAVLGGHNWPENMRQFALGILRDNLVPFIKSKLN
ncbi:MAG: anti-sigma factor antagonist [Bacilli bacterium]|nr:anti-sigma factor antagonist [Mollicutes bacterium]MDY3898881.1 anti-sigma factor antagonist [Bacilli bacterium]